MVILILFQCQQHNCSSTMHAGTRHWMWISNRLSKGMRNMAPTRSCLQSHGMGSRALAFNINEEQESGFNPWQEWGKELPSPAINVNGKQESMFECISYCLQWRNQSKRALGQLTNSNSGMRDMAQQDHASIPQHEWGAGLYSLQHKWRTGVRVQSLAGMGKKTLESCDQCEWETRVNLWMHTILN